MFDTLSNTLFDTLSNTPTKFAHFLPKMHLLAVLSEIIFPEDFQQAKELKSRYCASTREIRAISLLAAD